MTAADLGQCGRAARFVTALFALSDTELVRTYRAAADVGARGWMVQSVALGIAQRRGPRGSGAVDHVSRTFGCSRATGFRLAAIFDRIIAPRVESDAEAAFPLTPREFYVLAVELGPKAKLSPIEALEIAERKHASGGYTTRRFRADLSGNAVADLNAQLARALRRVLKLVEAGGQADVGVVNDVTTALGVVARAA